MILSNTEIHRALDDGRLVIKPEPSPRKPAILGAHCPYDTHSVDLRLSDEISVPQPGQFAYDLTQPGRIAETIQKHSVTHTIAYERPFRLAPNQFILGRTSEWVALPIRTDNVGPCLAARIEGKSSRARFGLLVHFTAPTVHPGFEGHLTLEMINLGASDILLVPGMYIAQLIVEQVFGVPDQNPSQFQGQTTAAGGTDCNISHP